MASSGQPRSSSSSSHNSNLLLVFLGAAGSGKGTQSQLLSERFGFNIVSAGDTLRQVASNPSNDEEREVAGELQKLMAAGKIVPEEITARLLRKKLVDFMNSGSTGIILEGYPRTTKQCNTVLTDFIPTLRSALQRDPLVLCFHLVASEATLRERLKGRLVHVQSGRVYHLRFCPPAREGVDDITGDPLIRRADDQSDDAIQTRFNVYARDTLPVVKMLQENGFPMTEVPDIGGIEEINQFILKILKEKGALSE